MNNEMWSDVVSESVQRLDFCSYLDVSAIYWKSVFEKHLKENLCSIA